MLALGLANREVTVDDLAKGTPPVPRFNTPAIAYVLAADLKKGDTVEISLANGEGPLLTNSETLSRGQGDLSAAGGKAGGAGRRLAAGVEIFRHGQDHARRQDPDRAVERARSRSSRARTLFLLLASHSASVVVHAPLHSIH